MNWLRRLFVRPAPSIADPSIGVSVSDPLDVRRREESAAGHLREGAPYQHHVDRPLPFMQFHGGATVALDRIYASTVNNSTVHVITPTEHYGRSMLNQVEQIAEIIRRTDPNLAGLVLFWPRTGTQHAYFNVPLFAIADAAAPTDGGRLDVFASDEGNPAISHARAGIVTRYTDPDFGHCEPEALADALGIPVAELAPLMPEVHQRAAAAPGWWEACAAADDRSQAAAADFRAILQEWDLG